MNLQSMMKQAQKMQKDMMKAKEEIDKMTFTATSSLVTVEMKGTKELTKVTISKDTEKEDIEMLQDMIVIAVNDAISQIDKITDQKLGKYTQGMSGLF